MNHTDSHLHLFCMTVPRALLWGDMQCRCKAPLLSSITHPMLGSHQNMLNQSQSLLSNRQVTALTTVLQSKRGPLPLNCQARCPSQCLSNHSKPHHVWTYTFICHPSHQHMKQQASNTKKPFTQSHAGEQFMVFLVTHLPLSQQSKLRLHHLWT